MRWEPSARINSAPATPAGFFFERQTQRGGLSCILKPFEPSCHLNGPLRAHYLTALPG